MSDVAVGAETETAGEDPVLLDHELESIRDLAAGPEGMPAYFAKQVIPVLIDEVRLLRSMIERLALSSLPHDPDRLFPDCPRSEGCCWWCGVILEDVTPELHRTECPWPELEAAVTAWRPPSPR